MEVERTLSPATPSQRSISCFKGSSSASLFGKKGVERAPMKERLPLSGAIWLQHRTAFPSLNARLMPGWSDAKASSLCHLHALMFTQQGTEQISEPGGEGEHVDEL